MTMPCPPNPPPPAGTTMWPAHRPVSGAILAWSRANLKYPKGTLVTANVGGEDVIARLETHYHPPNGPIQPWGCHKGNTIYAPTSPIDPSQYGVVIPVGAVDAPGTTTDPWVEAGGSWYDSETRGTNWTLVAVSAAATALVIAGFWAALHFTGKARLAA